MKDYMLGIPFYRFYYDKVDEIHEEFKKLKWVRQESNYIWEGVEADGYSGSVYDITSATKDGIIYPSLDPSIFELKFPNTDIEGRVVGDK